MHWLDFRLIDKVLYGIKWNFCVPYIDDVLVFSRTFKDHLELLEIVFRRFGDVNLTTKPTKCIFSVDVIKYFGPTISIKGVSPDTEEIKSVQMFPRPRNVDKVRHFLGLASYYRKFVENFAKKAKPLPYLAMKKLILCGMRNKQNHFKL